MILLLQEPFVNEVKHEIYREKWRELRIECKGYFCERKTSFSPWHSLAYIGIQWESGCRHFSFTWPIYCLLPRGEKIAIIFSFRCTYSSLTQGEKIATFLPSHVLTVYCHKVRRSTLPFSLCVAFVLATSWTFVYPLNLARQWLLFLSHWYLWKNFTLCRGHLLGIRHFHKSDL